MTPQGPANGSPFDPTTAAPAPEDRDEPPAKRTKTQACSRCRRRKQKCDDQRPCANCARSGEQCNEAVLPSSYQTRPPGPGFPPLSSDHHHLHHHNHLHPSTHTPLAWLGDIASLEERISRLEETNARLQAVVDDNRNGHDHAQESSLPSSSSRVHEASRKHHHSDEEHHHRRRVSFASGPGPGPGLGPEASLSRSSPAIGLLATFARSEEDNPPAPSLPPTPSFHGGGRANNTAQRHDQEVPLDIATEASLFDTYQDKVHCRYPFLRLDDFRNPARRPKEAWASYFTNMIFSIGLLLEKPHSQDWPCHHSTYQECLPPSHNHSYTHQTFYRLAVTKYLSHVFALQDRLLHIQAHLLLAMHAIYSPSTERIISIASATMRYCVMAQLHLADAEPLVPSASSTSDSSSSFQETAATKLRIQMRRRVFWSAYTLDRAVGTTFDLPFSVPDYQITVKLYANIDDAELDAACGTASFPDHHHHPRGRTSVSAALHVVYCRQIQSEILNTTLHRDFSTHFNNLPHWRLRVLDKLDRWRALCHRYADADADADADGSSGGLGSHSRPNPGPGPGSNTHLRARTRTRTRTFTHPEWLHMIYNYSLAMLHQPTRMTCPGPAGDWTVKSCIQACLIFRKFQRCRGPHDHHNHAPPIAELWLGLVAQFKCGVALLYCFFATPPRARTEAYAAPEAAEAVRACSVVLSILAERWPQSVCLRDAFDILAREVPLFELSVPTNVADSAAAAAGVGPRKMRSESADALMALMGQLEIIVVHRNTLRMIREMALDEFPRPLSPVGPESRVQTEEFLANATATAAATTTTTTAAAQFGEEASPSCTRTSITGDMFQPMTPHFFQSSVPGLEAEGFDLAALGFPGDFDLLDA
ncbi:hypothetical protein BDP55DRAFT_634899 [Colletotrichum godetiae]|uniref:Zn(2)-C6 fungal-type domain-containing protein n=1 Tax=Colletotrichum godetiae TaxID=1209918 RepID=A0AAJ0AFQ9_9PEZI|nr:uncharacterized protein BDP55DRAFT_634899 [Colletotrichum godetiae]KAK1672389.1 hypothetical protein BDP55DRAFT_634899 [Colletotrichum godetiae]